MKTTITLDYHAILANQAQPVHFALLFETPESTLTRPQPAAFTIVIDRSGSMSGPPLEAAKSAAKNAVKNLRTGDLFALVTFDDSARTVIPLSEIPDKAAAMERIDTVQSGGSTNLTGGWMLGRDELRKAPTGTMRRLLLLSDGQLNVGITDPDQVAGIVGQGLEMERIRTSCLGFGPSYVEDLLARLARVTNGEFYDANSPEKLPAIFEAELDGLQKTVVMNLRVRLKSLDFVEGIRFLGGREGLALPDGRQEYALGDLVADEKMAAVFQLDVLAIPEIAPGRPAASLEGEGLVEAEMLYDRVEESGIASVTETHTVRICPTQSPADVKVNESALSWITPPQAARIVEQAMALRDRGEVEQARQVLTDGIQRIEAYGHPDQVKDALALLSRTLAQIKEDGTYRSSRKSMLYSSSSYQNLRRSSHWSADESMPEFKRRPKPISPEPADPENTV
ncbi:MAG: VWA domain-containing protein [Opitutaceae bacterium]